MKLLSFFLLVATAFVYSADKNSRTKMIITIPPSLPLSELFSPEEMEEVRGMIIKPCSKKNNAKSKHTSAPTSSNSSYQTFDEIDGNKRRKTRSEIIGCCSCLK